MTRTIVKRLHPTQMANFQAQSSSFFPDTLRNLLLLQKYLNL